MAARGFPYTDLKDFLAALERAGELRRVSVPVDPTLEISEIVTRTVRAGGPALLFERPTRGEMPVAINLFGTERRMAMALGVDVAGRDRRPDRRRWSSRSCRSGWSGHPRTASARSCSSSRCRRRRSRPRPARRSSTGATTST